MIMLIWYKTIWNESYQKIHTVQLAWMNEFCMKETLMGCMTGVELSSLRMVSVVVNNIR